MLRSLAELFLDTIETIVIAFSIFLVVYLFFMQPHQVNGLSMVPTFQNGDYLLTDKVSYRISEPKRGDIVVFHAPKSAGCVEGTGCDYIKRIIAVPGETVSIKNSTFYINGEPLKEDYIPSNYVTEANKFFLQHSSYTLQTGEYLAVGDNRPHSSDSREWGPIQETDIVGKAFFRYLPLSEIGIIKSARY